ncbi:hypothetical protein ACFVR6_07995 [Microbacterium sp. NPDC058021]|uniref:hypothetical protein n=1 Tax=Microbacterium sp. NPDC058021 TaxID=3346306 RepID=UPI0036D96F3B
MSQHADSVGVGRVDFDRERALRSLWARYAPTMRKKPWAAAAAVVMAVGLAGCVSPGGSALETTPRASPSPAASSPASIAPTPTPSVPDSAAPPTCEDITPEGFLADLQSRHPSVSIVTEFGPSDFEERGLVTDVFECAWGPADTEVWGDVALYFGYARVIDESALIAAIEELELSEVAATSGRLFFSTEETTYTERPFWIVDGGLHWASNVDHLKEWTGFSL